MSSEKQDVDDKASSGVSLGSDALMLPWYTGQSSLDMGLCCNLTCMALSVLYRMKRYHTVVQVPPSCPNAQCSPSDNDSNTAS